MEGFLPLPARLAGKPTWPRSPVTGLEGRHFANLIFMEIGEIHVVPS